MVIICNTKDWMRFVLAYMLLHLILHRISHQNYYEMVCFKIQRVCLTIANGCSKSVHRFVSLYLHQCCKLPSLLDQKIAILKSNRYYIYRWCVPRDFACRFLPITSCINFIGFISIAHQCVWTKHKL